MVWGRTTANCFFVRDAEVLNMTTKMLVDRLYARRWKERKCVKFMVSEW